MESPGANISLDMQQKMLQDAVELMKSKLVPDGHEYQLALESGFIDPPPNDIAQLTEFLSFLIKAGSIAWKELPPSWINSIPLARECMRANTIPHILRERRRESRHKLHFTDLPIVCQSDVQVVLNALDCLYLCQWEEIPVHLRSNSEVVLEAWKSILRWNEEYYTRLTSVSPNLNRDFFRSCIEDERIEEWDDLPPEYRDSIDFARDIRSFPSESIAFHILNSFPDLHEEEETWDKLLESNLTDYYKRKLMDIFAPYEILSDRNFMLRACKFDSVLIVVEEPLADDWSFLVEVLDRYPDQLAHLRHDVQSMFPDLVLAYLPEFSRTLPPLSQGAIHGANIRRLALALHSSFWSERENLFTWFMSGLPHPQFIDESIIVSEVCDTDEDLSMLIAAHGDENLRSSLRNDKNFMMKALECNPFLFSCASDTLQMDFDIALCAFGTSNDVFKMYVRQSRKESELRFLETFLVDVDELLLTHHLFSDLFVFGVKQPQCVLYALGQGRETALSLKKTIAEYLGVPTGRKLRLLRSCANLRNHLMESRSN